MSGPRAATRLGRWLDRTSRQWRAFAAMATRLWPHARPRKRKLMKAFGLTFLFMLLKLLEPWPLKLVFDNVFGSRPLPAMLEPLADLAGGNRWIVIGCLSGSIVLLAVLSGFVYYHLSITSARLGQQVVSGLRLELWDHVQALPWSFHDRRRTGDLLVRFVADIRLLRDALLNLPLQLAEAGLLLVGMGIVMLLMDWMLALATFLVVPLVAVLVQRYRAPMKEAMRQQRRNEGVLADVTADALGAMKVIQAFGLEARESKRFSGANDRGVRSGNRAARLEAKLKWSSEVAVGTVTALVVGLAAQRIVSGALSPGGLIVFVSYLRSFVRPLRRVSKVTERAARTTTAGERILEILDLVPQVRDAPGAVEAPRLEGHVTFDHVGFEHREGAPVLQDVTLSLVAGERVGIVGPTGAGKSTLLSLVPRFHDPTSGRVLLDGHDVRGLTLASVRAQVSMVFQEPILFATTIAENIAAGKLGATQAEIEEAARRAGIHHVIESLPRGYQTELGERGGTLSGGQRQCVAIARAMMRDAPIVLLDEPTTGLDARAAMLVMDAQRELMEGRTVLVISHELRRLRDVDRVVVLHDGRVEQDGSFAELAGSAGLFRDLHSVDADGGDDAAAR